MFKFLLFTFIILTFIPFNISVPINGIDFNILTRRQNVNNACYVKAAKESARSTTIVLINKSGTDLFYISSPLDHGIWTSGCDPSTTQIVPNGQSISFSNESDGFATGDGGSVVYSIGSEAPPLTFTINWSNPFTGSNSYEVNFPQGSKYAYSAPFPPSGDNAYYEITIL
ncbi:hypothetical protein RclHR1_01880009 [Rhizophagus clarus]|uniref:Crystal protein ET79 n=1 Tax=Rhizophagus clarus TaxID=94130 RepID=A0A2Z6RG96_9GLOM|nr:hypothetical protein RclHR1_01880009 [Rhizophagus clarus]GES90250.1 crystal protein ET79 [Rhizophagus clarus]